MRIAITLQPLEKKTKVPINYQYPLSGAIYRILSNASPEYASWLHDKGYLTAAGKPMKLFTFSRLEIPAPERLFNVLIIKKPVPCRLYVSSPMIDEFVQHFVTGLFQDEEIVIGNPHTVARFRVESVETLPDPEFIPEMNMYCLSPVVVSTMHERNGRVYPYYLRADDDRLSEMIQTNAVSKYKLIYGHPPENKSIAFQLDRGYVERKGGPDKISKLIRIKEWNEKERVDVKAFLAPFTLSGDPELIRCVYECGIGEKNSIGFGMISVASEK